MAKQIRNWVIVLVTLIVLTFLWHNIIFGSQYPGQLEGIVATNVEGEQAPRMAYFMLAHILVTAVFMVFLPGVARTKNQFLGYGALVGLTTFGFFAILSHGLFQNWTPWLMWMDVSFGTLTGVLTGLVVFYLSPKTTA